MADFEYKVIYARPGGFLLFPWASKDLKDSIGRQGLEKQLNVLAAEGWEVVSCTSATFGTIFYMFPMATILLKRQKQAVAAT